MVLKIVKALEIINHAYADGIISLAQKNAVIKSLNHALESKDMGIDLSLALGGLPSSVREKINALLLE